MTSKPRQLSRSLAAGTAALLRTPSPFWWSGGDRCATRPWLGLRVRQAPFSAAGPHAQLQKPPPQTPPALQTPQAAPASTSNSLYGGPATRRVRTVDLFAAKQRGERWAMLTSYDQCSASIFDKAGIPALLVGDSAANNVYGYETTLPVTAEELLPLVRAVARATRRAMVVADLPFGSYEEGPAQALRTAVRFMKEGGCHAVKLEGGRRVAKQIAAVSGAGIPVVGHVGFTPQSEHVLGGYRVQGRGGDAENVLADARAAAEAGAFAIVLEMVPGDLGKRITEDLAIPTIGIGAGPDTDAQVLVWQDMAGLRPGKLPRFVKRYLDLSTELAGAARAFADDVRTGRFPAPEHTFQTSSTNRKPS